MCTSEFSFCLYIPRCLIKKCISEIIVHHMCLLLLRLWKRAGDRELRSQPLQRPEPPCFQPQTLTDICDVEREPEEESVADQLREEQAQRELYYALKEREPSRAYSKGEVAAFVQTCKSHQLPGFIHVPSALVCCRPLQGERGQGLHSAAKLWRHQPPAQRMPAHGAL